MNSCHISLPLRPIVYSEISIRAALYTMAIVFAPARAIFLVFFGSLISPLLLIAVSTIAIILFLIFAGSVSQDMSELSSANTVFSSPRSGGVFFRSSAVMLQRLAASLASISHGFLAPAVCRFLVPIALVGAGVLRPRAACRLRSPRRGDGPPPEQHRRIDAPVLVQDPPLPQPLLGRLPALLPSSGPSTPGSDTYSLRLRLDE